jgi:hypothetical protein
MQIRCDSCGRGVTVADTGVLPERCPHCRGTPVPTRLGRWRIERLLAAGGMGEVYVATHATLGTEVAIKLLPHGPGTADIDVLRERFAREARLTAAIAHPGVVRVIDFDADGERAFLVLELVDGRSLRSLLRDGPLAIDRAVAIARDVAEVLAAAHARGVVHRDIKPENVVVGRDGRVRVLDFGIARALADEQPITRTGEILGTPEYMAQEQLLEGSQAIDARTDVHALGVLLFELLTGRSPFAGHNLFQVLKLVESLVPPAPSTRRSGVSPELNAVVARALAKEPAARFADAAEFAAALPRASPEPPAPVSRRGPLRMLGALGIASMVFGGALGAALGLAFGAGNGSTLTLTGDVATAAPTDVPTAVARAELLLASVEPDPAELSRVRRELAAVVDDESSAAGHVADAADVHAVLGRLDLRLGAFQRAMRDLQRAAELGVGETAELAAIARCVVHVLLPALAGAPDWVAASESTRPTADDADGDESDASTGVRPWSRAVDLLVDGRGVDAFAALRDRRDDATPPERAIALLAASRACPDPDRVRRFAARWQPADPDPAWTLATALLEPPAGRLEALTRQVDRSPPDTADRWLAELCRARLAAELGEGDPRRLWAAAELAWLTGSGRIAMLWCAAFRLDLVARGHPLGRDEGRSLLRLVGETATSPARATTLGLTRAVVEEGGDAWPELLAIEAPLPTSLRALRSIAGDDALARAVGQLWLGDTAALAAAHRALPADAPRAADLALLLAAHGPADDATELWRRALRGGADPGWLDFVPLRRAPSPGAIAAALVAAVEAGVPAPSQWALIRAAVRAGAPLELLLAPPELAPLRDTVLTEVFAGLPE